MWAAGWRDQGYYFYYHTLVCPMMGTSSPQTGLRHAWAPGSAESGDRELVINVPTWPRGTVLTHSCEHLCFYAISSHFTLTNWRVSGSRGTFCTNSLSPPPSLLPRTSEWVPGPPPCPLWCPRQRPEPRLVSRKYLGSQGFISFDDKKSCMKNILFLISTYLMTFDCL